MSRKLVFAVFLALSSACGPATPGADSAHASAGEYQDPAGHYAVRFPAEVGPTKTVAGPAGANIIVAGRPGLAFSTTYVDVPPAEADTKTPATLLNEGLSGMTGSEVVGPVDAKQTDWQGRPALMARFSKMSKEGTLMFHQTAVIVDGRRVFFLIMSTSEHDKVGSIIADEFFRSFRITG